MSNRSSSMLAALLLVVALPAAAVDRGDPAAGEKLAEDNCVSCHGEKGRSTNPQYPILAGQYADYLYQTLLAYQTGDRQNAVMKGMVSNLSKEEMWDLAAYYEEQSGDLRILDR